MCMCICVHSQKYIAASRLRDALSIPEILGAIQHLEMPVSAAWYVQQTFPKLGDEKRDNSVPYIYMHIYIYTYIHVYIYRYRYIDI